MNAQCDRDALDGEGFGARIWAAADRGDITHEQAPLVVRSLLTAGVDTTVHGLAATLYAFAPTPSSGSGCAGGALARVAFDEAVRWQSPVQTFFRTVTTDVALAGVRVPADAKILMFLGAANRGRGAADGPRGPRRPHRARGRAAPSPQQHPPLMGVAARPRTAGGLNRPRRSATSSGRVIRQERPIHAPARSRCRRPRQE